MEDGRAERRTAAVNRLETWADGVVAGLDAQEDIDRSLLQALRVDPSLREETAVRRADALRAAALGLGPAGCAAAAGVTERLLLNWQAKDPSFAEAMAAAALMAAGERERGRPVATSDGPGAAALRVVLRAVRDGVAQPSAAVLGGWSERSFLRLRRRSPEVAALLAAARRARARARRAERRGGPVGGRGYRLVRVDDGPLAHARGAGDS
ncbi:hypothetical protein [Streptomyces alboflavus]|uniref:hypothetical protein n=1 Tax=Streptomyces alboflavus TaxID=67267 RepID=UPI000B429860|nr:hypothetical protein [Streptomyces alboflavus]